MTESSHNKHLHCRIKMCKPCKIGPSEPFPRTSETVIRNGVCFWRFHNQIYVLFAMRLPHFPSIQSVFNAGPSSSVAKGLLTNPAL